jgi:hypothetical protein
MNRSIALQRCFNHVQREAAARCPACGQFFCRECITEHDDKVICAACLKKLARSPFVKSRVFARILQLSHCLLGLLAAWFIFYLLGEALLAMPASFHEGTIWESK